MTALIIAMLGVVPTDAVVAAGAVKFAKCLMLMAVADDGTCVLITIGDEAGPFSVNPRPVVAVAVV